MIHVGGIGEPVLQIRGVRKTFEAEQAPVRALRGLDFEMAPGEFVAVMGPSGCGKSTMLNLVAGLDAVDEGTVVLDGEQIHAMDEDELARMRRRHIGIVFQFFNLLEGMTVLENVALPAMIAGLKRKPAETRARDLLDLLGLSDKGKQLPGVLSGGQRQRLAIARALVAKPEVFLFDDSFSALDLSTDARLRSALKPVTRHTAVVVVAQRVSTIVDADHIVVLDDGLVVGAGTHDELLATCPTYVEIVQSQQSAQEAA